MTENRYRHQNRSHRAPLDQLNALRELAAKISSLQEALRTLRHHGRSPHHHGDVDQQQRAP